MSEWSILERAIVILLVLFILTLGAYGLQEVLDLEVIGGGPTSLEVAQ